MNRSLDGYDVFNKSLTGLLDQGTTTAYQTVAGMTAYQTVAGMSSYVLASTLATYNYLTNATLTAYLTAQNYLASSLPYIQNYTLTQITSNTYVAYYFTSSGTTTFPTPANQVVPLPALSNTVSLSTATGTLLTSSGFLLATASVPYNSTDGLNNIISCNVPIGVFVDATANYPSNNIYLTFQTVQNPAQIYVFKNGVYLQYITNLNYNGTNITKNFVSIPLGAGQNNISWRLSSYMFNILFNFTPTNPTFGNTDVYSFYTNIPFQAVSNQVTPNTLNYTQLKYGLVVNTTTLLSTSNQFYSVSSWDTAGGSLYFLTNAWKFNNIWNAGNLSGYIPQSLSTFWTGFYQVSSLYANQLFVSNTINFKNTGSTNTIQWIDTDANSGVALANVNYSNNSLNITSNTALNITGSNDLNLNPNGKVNSNRLVIDRTQSTVPLLQVGGVGSLSANTGIWCSGQLALAGRLYFYYNWAIISNNGGNLYFYYGGSPESANSGPYVSPSGTFNNVSDRKFKINVNDISYGLNEILQLRPISYNLKDLPEGRTQLGFVAQEIKEHLPAVVEYDKGNDGFCVSYTEIIPVLTKAIQEQNEFIKLHQKEIDILKQEIIKLQK